jgi:hypothetical protein
LIVLVGAAAIAIVPVLRNSSISTAAKSPNPILAQTSDVNLALTQPDKFNWGLLVQISQRAPDELQTTVQLANGQTGKTNNALWETWADDIFTFPSSPDPANPPKWQDRNKQGKRLTPILQQLLRETQTATEQKKFHAQVSLGGTEEVRRNQSAFDFLISNSLWYVEGQACAFKKGVDQNGYPNGVKIDFKSDAVEVKAVWKSITEADKAQYHWNYDAQGNLFGLTGLHIISKTLPNWSWATFEWVGNPGRCDWMGCNDSFGVIPARVPPTVPTGKQYPPGTLTPDLLKMFQQAGYNGEWLAEWENYRLKGSQIDFTDTTGKPTLLGNSIIEDGFAQTSSCISCHANASVDVDGNNNPSIGFAGDLDRQSRNGPLDPGWFYDLNTWSRTRGSYKLKYYPLDFVWAIFNAQKAGPAKPIPTCK